MSYVGQEWNQLVANASIVIFMFAAKDSAKLGSRTVSVIVCSASARHHENKPGITRRVSSTILPLYSVILSAFATSTTWVGALSAAAAAAPPHPALPLGLPPTPVTQEDLEALYLISDFMDTDLHSGTDLAHI